MNIKTAIQAAIEANRMSVLKPIFDGFVVRALADIEDQFIVMTEEAFYRIGRSGKILNRVSYSQHVENLRGLDA